MFSSLHKQTKIAVIAIFILVGIIVGLAMSVAIKMIIPKNTPISKAEQKTVVEQKETKPPEEKKEEKAIEEKIEKGEENNIPQEVTDGKYIVGKDIKEGIYKLLAISEAESYYKVTDGNGDEAINTIEDMMFFNFAYTQLKNGQVISVLGATLQSKESMSPYKDSIYVSGQYKVGYDIPSGDYTVTPKGGIGNIRLSSSPNSRDEIFSQYIEGDATIKIKDGQYLTINNVELKK